MIVLNITEKEPQTASTFEVYDPAHHLKLADVQIFSDAMLREAVNQMRMAHYTWAKLSFKQRAQQLYTFRRLLIQHREKLLDLVVAETGKSRAEGLAEIFFLADLIGYYVKHAPKFLADQKVHPHLMKDKQAYISYHPLGVVGVIAPWNFPLALALGDTITACIAGNSVVLKPSEITPLTALEFEKLAKQAGIPLAVVTGAGETGALLVDYVDLVAFTGSVATGKKVMARAAQRLTPLILELGGKDPLIILKDADLERAAKGASWSALVNCGQVCISTERIYVEEPVYDEFVAKLRSEVEKLRQGIETRGEFDIDIGSLSTPHQLEVVERQVQDAIAKGAKVLTGGKQRDDLPGLFYEPTILTNVTEDMLVMQEETFGPVLPIIKVKDAQQAIEHANLTRFGLASSIWTGDIDKGRVLARQLEAGTTSINDALTHYFIPELPFGGVKESGLGYRHGGAEGLRRFCRVQSVVVSRLSLKRSPLWYPYTKKLARLEGLLLDLVFRRGK